MVFGQQMVEVATHHHPSIDLETCLSVIKRLQSYMPIQACEQSMQSVQYMWAELAVKFGVMHRIACDHDCAPGFVLLELFPPY